MTALWLAWELAAGLLLGGSVRDLAHPDWPTRERATARLRAAGWLALPVLPPRHPDPEVARRADSLRGPLVRTAGDLRAAWVLAGPCEPDAEALYADHPLRRRLARLTAGLTPYCTPDPVLPENDPTPLDCWVYSREPHHWFGAAVRRHREQLHPGWFVAPGPRPKP